MASSNGRRGNPFAESLIFAREFFRHPREVGSIIPSSGFLERRLVTMADIGAARTVVELGSGTGGTTRALLAAMHPDARLLCMEINAHFRDKLRAIGDPRVIVDGAGAITLREALQRHGLPAPDVVISGIPFSTMSDADGERIIRGIHEVLPAGGRFVAYQVRDQVKQLSVPILGEAEVQMELRNIPPMRLYRWNKCIDTAAERVPDDAVTPATAD